MSETAGDSPQQKSQQNEDDSMADGSTQFITEDIDYATYQRLGDRRDGEPVGRWGNK